MLLETYTVKDVHWNKDYLLLLSKNVSLSCDGSIIYRSAPLTYM